MIQLTANVYDAGGVGDSNLTQSTAYPGLSATARVTKNWYDWRDRLVASKSGVQTTEDTTTHRAKKSGQVRFLVEPRKI